MRNALWIRRAALAPRWLQARSRPRPRSRTIRPSRSCSSCRSRPAAARNSCRASIGAKLTEAWKQQVIVESRPGGAGNIAMEAVQRAKPDGYTLILGHVGTLAVNPAMFAKLPYDPDKGFIPVTMIATVPSLLVVNPNVPAKDFKEFVALAKAKPGTLYYGSAGNGSSGHLAMEYLKQAAHIDLVHVPYKGTGPMMTDLLGGQTQATFTGATPLMPHIKQGKLRPLAVGSAKRIAALPDVPTVAESGVPGLRDVAVVWHPRARGDARRDRAQAFGGDQPYPQVARGGRASRVRRVGSARIYTGGIREVHRSRAEALGGRREGGQHQAGVSFDVRTTAIRLHAGV